MTQSNSTLDYGFLRYPRYDSKTETIVDPVKYINGLNLGGNQWTKDTAAFSVFVETEGGEEVVGSVNLTMAKNDYVVVMNFETLGLTLPLGTPLTARLLVHLTGSILEPYLSDYFMTQVSPLTPYFAGSNQNAVLLKVISGGIKDVEINPFPSWPTPPVIVEIPIVNIVYMK